MRHKRLFTLPMDDAHTETAMVLDYPEPSSQATLLYRPRLFPLVTLHYDYSVSFDANTFVYGNFDGELLPLHVRMLNSLLCDGHEMGNICVRHSAGTYSVVTRMPKLVGGCDCPICGCSCHGEDACPNPIFVAPTAIWPCRKRRDLLRTCALAILPLCRQGASGNHAAILALPEFTQLAKAVNDYWLVVAGYCRPSKYNQRLCCFLCYYSALEPVEH